MTTPKADDAPRMLKTTVYLIRELGVTVAALLWLAWFTTHTLAENTSALQTMVSELKVFTSQVRGDHDIMKRELEDIKRAQSGGKF